ncbi:unnamed protein product [Schistosoma margrebowiei]|uniref:Uncharacterized protein n=1 Tax=Schistosoma margrebowiei TaxID=48269 RepID=A0A183LCL9_9TREM|nr:unnamed protein product [Schistosoma margrebowiei]
MVVEGSQQKTLNPGFVLFVTYQQGVIEIMRELVLPDGLDPVSPGFVVADVTTGLSEPRLTSFRTVIYSIPLTTVSKFHALERHHYIM